MSFRPPVRDIVFSLRHVAGFDAVTKVVPEADFETTEAVLEAAGEFAADVIAPLNTPGDKAGVTLTDSGVRPAPGFGDAYTAFWQAGWNSLSADPAFGGQGLPETLEVAVFEMVQSACLSFGLCPMLTQGVIEALTAHGSQAQQTLYLPKLVSGEWTGTMNLTEPQAGSDLAAITTRAEPDGEGGWRLTGQKIFITWGDQDFTDNIVHLVLARTPGAPAGVKGISLFLAPKRLVDDGGVIGDANAVRPVGVEHKLGIHASPTCTMVYGDKGGAVAYLIGEENKGMAAMFTMMNNARINVGLQGVGIAERATQRAVDYAQGRVQGTVGPARQSVVIAEHPDVRRMLVRMRALTMGARALTYYAFGQIDRSVRLDDGPAADRAAILTPLAKAWGTDVGCEVASLGVQVHGGMGYIEETGAAQHFRDARIAPIYEGTNGIQAADLVSRKLGLDGGIAFDGLIADVRADAVHVQLIALADAVEIAAATLREAEPDDRLAASYSFLTMTSVMVAGWLLERVGRAIDASAESDDFGRGRRAAIEFFLSAIVPEALGLGAAITVGAAPLYAAPVAGLA
jgi:alkylation response protein AidB-like acyl-CoA dehydrogenase